MRPEIKQELDRIKAQSPSGRLTVPSVIESAKSKRSPLHNEFTWDTQEALRKNLETEARNLIQAYHIIVITPSGPVRTRHFVSLSSDRVNGGGYRTVHEVMGDEVARAQLLQDAMLQLEAFKSRFNSLTELSVVFEAIKEVEKKRPRQQKPQRRQARAERAAA